MFGDVIILVSFVVDSKCFLLKNICIKFIYIWYVNVFGIYFFLIL